MHSNKDNINIEEVIACLPYPAHLKDGKTGKYLCSNKANLQIYNLQYVNQIVGITINDLDAFMRSSWGSGFAEEVKKSEHLVIVNNQIVEDTRTILNLDGKVILQRMTKNPIWGKYTSKVTSIFTLSQDLTNTLSLVELYELYKKHYHSKKEIILRFLSHIGCESYFNQLPTESELKVLLAKKIVSSNKAVASILNLAPKTVETYSSYLLKKIKNENLSQVLSVLRELKNY